MSIKVGDTAHRTRTITAEDIEQFAEVSHDRNPVHLDEAFAETTQFGKRIAHGMLAVSFISAVLGNDLPGHGAIYLGQDIKFKAPVYIGDTITATVEVIKYREDRRIATLKTTATNQDDTVVAVGEAVTMLPAES